MFTGLIEALGKVKSLNKKKSQAKLEIEIYPFKGARLGESVSINGVCLTIKKITKKPFSLQFDIGPDTLKDTALGSLLPGMLVNCERALLPTSRLGGHIVQGHVDGVGTLITTGKNMRVRIPDHLERYCIPKGSITIQGVSLTIQTISGSDCFFQIVPTTLENTVFGSPGNLVNIEVDILAKYVAKHVEKICQTLNEHS